MGRVPRGTPHPLTSAPVHLHINENNMTHNPSQDSDKAVVEYVEQVDEKAVPQAGFIVVSHPTLCSVELS